MASAPLVSIGMSVLQIVSMKWDIFLPRLSLTFGCILVATSMNTLPFDDLAIAAEDPRKIVGILIKHYKFKLKGTGPITVYLRIDFFHDECGVLCMTPRKYIKKMCATFEWLFSWPSSQTGGNITH